MSPHGAELRKSMSTVSDDSVVEALPTGERLPPVARMARLLSMVSMLSGSDLADIEMRVLLLRRGIKDGKSLGERE
jgi:hypothetical protein